MRTPLATTVRTLAVVAIAAMSLAACTSSKKEPVAPTVYGSQLTLGPILSGDEPRVSEDAARAMIANSTSWTYSKQPGSFPEQPGQLTLGRLSVKDQSDLVQPWTDRLAWYFDFTGAALNFDDCPKVTAKPGPKVATSPAAAPQGPQHTVIAIDASGIGDGLYYADPTSKCGKAIPAQVQPLLRYWSATWKVTKTTPRQVSLSFDVPDCGTLYGQVATQQNPFTWLIAFKVPYGKTGCKNDRTGTTTVDASKSDPKATVPALHHPLEGYIRIVDDGVVAPIKY